MSALIPSLLDAFSCVKPAFTLAALIVICISFIPRFL
nr:MAG TPA_asm: hypothetical protein [Caudoviricetes sp.]